MFAAGALAVLCHENMSKVPQKLQLLQKSAHEYHHPSKQRIKGDLIINFISRATNKTKFVGKEKTLAWFVSRHPGTIRTSWLHFWGAVPRPEQNVLTFWCAVFHLGPDIPDFYGSEDHSQDTIIPKSLLKCFSVRCRNLIQMSPNSADCEDRVQNNQVQSISQPKLSPL